MREGFIVNICVFFARQLLSVDHCSHLSHAKLIAPVTLQLVILAKSLVVEEERDALAGGKFPLLMLQGREGEGWCM
jgi:hypothetical protein